MNLQKYFLLAFFYSFLGFIHGIKMKHANLYVHLFGAFLFYVF